MGGAGEARRHLERLATAPRPAGSAAEESARRYAAASLLRSGLRIREEPFSYSTVPGRFATPLAGILSIVLLFTAAHFGAAGRPAISLIVTSVGGGLLLLGGGWLARRGVLALPWGRAASVNLVGERGAPALWLVAHLDSKSQPIPIVVRAAGVVLTIVVWVIALLLGVLQLRGSAVEALWPPLAIAGLVCAMPVALSTVSARSAGALDNASGVATVLMTVSALPRDLPIGVLLTSAEELGLAGARAWVRQSDERRGAEKRGRLVAVNFDGVDDLGSIRLTYTGRQPRRLVAALSEGATAVGATARAGPLIPGVLLDGVAFANAGWDVVTVSKGSFGTVARIHTPSDSVDRMSGEGIAQVAAVTSHAVLTLYALDSTSG